MEEVIAVVVVVVVVVDSGIPMVVGEDEEVDSEEDEELTVEVSVAEEEAVAAVMHSAEKETGLVQMLDVAIPTLVGELSAIVAESLALKEVVAVVDQDSEEVTEIEAVEVVV